MKARLVVRGDEIRDENYEMAIFQELASCPATMQASKAADVYGLFKDHSVEQADATQA